MDYSDRIYYDYDWIKVPQGQSILNINIISNYSRITSTKTKSNTKVPKIMERLLSLAEKMVSLLDQINTKLDQTNQGIQQLNTLCAPANDNSNNEVLSNVLDRHTIDGNIEGAEIQLVQVESEIPSPEEAKIIAPIEMPLVAPELPNDILLRLGNNPVNDPPIAFEKSNEALISSPLPVIYESPVKLSDKLLAKDSHHEINSLANIPNTSLLVHDYPSNNNDNNNDNKLDGKESSKKANPAIVTYLINPFGQKVVNVTPRLDSESDSSSESDSVSICDGTETTYE